MILKGHKYIAIGSGNGLAPVWRQTITWTYTNLFSIETSGKKIPSKFEIEYQAIIWTNTDMLSIGF